MKKILCLMIAVLMLTLLCACGDKKPENTASGYTVDNATIDIVNNAYVATQTALQNATSLGFNGNAVKSATVDEKTTSARLSVSLDYMNSEKGKVFGCETIAKSGENSEVVQFYNTGEVFYGYKAGANYIIAKDKNLDAFVEDLFKDIEFFNASSITVLDTVIVKTDNGGYGFVLEYDFNDADFDAEKEIGKEFYSEKSAGMSVTATGLRVSGIIDTKGRLSTQSVTYTYTYPIEVEVQIQDADPDNSGVATTEKVTKTVSNEISFEFNFKYDITEVDVPDRIVLPEPDGEQGGEDSDEDKKPTKYIEVSIIEFNKLSANQTSNDSSNKTN